MRWVGGLLLLATVLIAIPAAAHLTPNSEVNLDFGQHEIVADIIIPQGEYGFATGNPVGNTAIALSRARAFLTGHVRLTSPDRAAWTMVIDRLDFAQIAGPPDLHAIATFTPAPGHDARRLAISWSAVIDQVPNHFVLFVARSDFAAGKLDDRRVILGALQGDKRRLAIDRGKADSLKGFRAAIALGMQHIVEGHDHLLFLIALLLPAPALAVAGMWRGRRGARATLITLARIVTAFTIGHSLTLIGAAFLGWQLPARPVEIGIALSILISAIHAWRPLFPGREPLVAGLFGLVHGLAFATVVSRFGLGMGEKAASILGFNLGIEIVQLLVVIAIMPALMMLANTRFFAGFRAVGAGCAGFAAVAWIIERIAGTPNPVAEAIDTGLAQAGYGVAALTLFAAIAFVTTRARLNPGDARL
ncbi:MAG: hypothetical protein B7Y47_12460 [Sphingomonas sp. 28-63-12]|nr:MAG: hypothetical protein B7Y47_12460 [Sphingomonas sp. 28-63-12]